MGFLMPLNPRACANDPHPPRSRTVIPGAAAAAALVLLVSGCGSSDNGVAAKSASEILAATRTAAQSASSVHVIAHTKITHGGSLKLDASLAKTQGHAQVSFYGLTIAVIRDGDTLYVKGNQGFAASLERSLGVKVPVGTWLKGPAKGALGQIGAFTEIETELPTMLSGSGPIAKGAKTKIDGQPAIALKEIRKLYTGTLYVATTGQPYPLKLTKSPTQAGPGESGETTFTNWNDPVTVSPPANAIDITQLQPVKKAH
jgi:hypothetical protein